MHLLQYGVNLLTFRLIHSKVLRIQVIIGLNSSIICLRSCLLAHLLPSRSNIRDSIVIDYVNILFD